MATISVHLENGFAHDEVILAAAGRERQEDDVTTRYQIGLARSVDLEEASESTKGRRDLIRL